MQKNKSAKSKKKPLVLSDEFFRRFGKQLGLQGGAAARSMEEVGINLSDPYKWDRLAAVALTEFGMTRKEFDECNPGYLMALIQRRLGTDGLKDFLGRKPEAAPKKPGAPIGTLANGELLKSYRKKEGKTQVEFAVAIGINEKSYQRAESGKHRLREENFQALAAGLSDWMKIEISAADLKSPKYPK